MKNPRLVIPTTLQERATQLAHAHIVLFKRTCRLVAAHEDISVTNDEKYQTCLIFGLHVTNDENAVNIARTRGNFVDPTCHE